MEQVGWCAMVDLGIVDGMRKRRAIYGKTQRDVVEKLNEALRDHQRGSLPKPGRVTVEQWLKTWLTSIEGGVRLRTLEHYRWIAETHIIPAIGRKQLAKLEPSDVEAMLNSKLRAGLSPRTVHHLRSVLRNALRMAERDRLVVRNAAALAKAPKVPQREMRTLAPAEVKAYLAAAAGDRLEALFVCALGLGMREGELMGLRWSCVDLEGGTLRVTHALQYQGGKPVLVEPKSTSSRRTMPLPAPVAEALRQHRVRQAQEQLAAKVWLNDMGLVFVGKHGQPLESTAVLRGHWSVLKAAGLERMRFHDLRHSCATLLLEAGIPDKVVAEVLGHSNPATTRAVYQHVTAGLRAQATAAQTRILGG
jgi:integrase